MMQALQWKRQGARQSRRGGPTWLYRLGGGRLVVEAAVQPA